MTRNNTGVPPFSLDNRASGMLLHVTSLPSSHGIGDFGPSALSWIDRLDQAGQSWWQMLPLGPTGYSNSPYQSISSFAANPLLVSPEWLVEDGLLDAHDTAHPSFPEAFVDYDSVLPFKLRLLGKAWENFKSGAHSDVQSEYEQFCHDHHHWLKDYSLFRVLKAKFGDAHYLDWPHELVQRKPAALRILRRELADQIGEASFAQFLLFRQANRMKAYAHEKGVRLIGDLPFFVSGDSSDVWANHQLFLLDEHRRPRFVAGVPPDYFSATGQLWGNPLYNWDVLRQSGYRWCIARLRSLLNDVDLIRLDHFRAFVAAWHIPADAPTAQTGTWVPGPGAEFFVAVKRKLGHLPFIAEDLGMITPDVYALRDEFRLPGMRVLQFAFDGDSTNPHLPQNYVENAVVYTGTHDNPPTRGWFEELPAEERERVWKYLRERGAKSSEAARALMELGWSSRAALAVAPLQDLLNLGTETRMNVPGRPEDNWRWRATEDMLADRAFEWLRELTKNANRVRASVAADSRALESASTNRGKTAKEHEDGNPRYTGRAIEEY
jgi:4-alpha-glucanotransferase